MYYGTNCHIKLKAAVGATNLGSSGSPVQLMMEKLRVESIIFMDRM
jgi:hypothetical protein